MQYCGERVRRCHGVQQGQRTVPSGPEPVLGGSAPLLFPVYLSQMELTLWTWVLRMVAVLVKVVIMRTCSRGKTAWMHSLAVVAGEYDARLAHVIRNEGQYVRVDSGESLSADGPYIVDLHKRS